MTDCNTLPISTGSVKVNRVRGMEPVVRAAEVGFMRSFRAANPPAESGGALPELSQK